MNSASGKGGAFKRPGAQPIRVVCAVIEDGGLVLVARRGPHDSQAGLWEFPGGKVRGGETPRQALAREIREELGVKIAVGAPLEPTVHRYAAETIELLPFRCTISSGKPAPGEHAAIAWVTRDRAAELAWSPADIPVFRQYVRGARNRRSRGKP
jgi:8-oxo-dGTP diphosphatase